MSKSEDKPRAWTPKEVAEQLCETALARADYWARQPDQTPQQMTRGTVFSIFSMLDGCSSKLPAFALVPDPHSGDKAYLIEHGENYYTRKPIRLMLHEIFCDIEKAYDEDNDTKPKQS